MIISNKKISVEQLLHFHKIHNRTEIISDVLPACWLHPADCNFLRHENDSLIFERSKIIKEMKIDNELVNRLADLSKLEFDELAKEGLKKDLQKIFDLVQKLEEINVEGVEPLIYMTDEKNVLRKDEIRDTVSKEEALQNAPQRDSDYFKVPKVIKK